jgi:hypothetical protein
MRSELMGRKLIGHSISNCGNLVPKAFGFNILLSPSLAARPLSSGRFGNSEGGSHSAGE